MTAAKHSRRNCFASLAALLTARLMPRDAFADDNSSELHNAARVDRGIAPASDEFAFAPGLVYPQTGSLGPTPRRSHRVS